MPVCALALSYSSRCLLRYCASAVEAMECFLPGAGSTGFWAVLEPVFGAGAFDVGGH